MLQWVLTQGWKYVLESGQYTDDKAMDRKEMEEIF